MHKTKSCGIWVLLWRISEGLLILKTFRVCTRSVVGCQYQSVFDGLLHPPKSCQKQTSFRDASKQHPSTTRFGWTFFIQKTCFVGTASFEHTFHYFEKILEKTWTMYKIYTYSVHLSQNLHILCAFKSKLAHTLCIFKPKFAHTLCANKPFRFFLKTFITKHLR